MNDWILQLVSVRQGELISTAISLHDLLLYKVTIRPLEGTLISKNMVQNLKITALQSAQLSSPPGIKNAQAFRGIALLFSKQGFYFETK